MDKIISILNALKEIEKGDTFSFVTNKKMPKTSIRTSWTKWTQTWESKYTLMNDLTKFVDEMENYEYNPFDIRNKVIVTETSLAINGLATLAESYANNQEVYDCINKNIVRLTQISIKIKKNYIKELKIEEPKKQDNMAGDECKSKDSCPCLNCTTKKNQPKFVQETLESHLKKEDRIKSN